MFGINSLLEENTQVRNHFRYLNWSIITSPNDISFPTCDAPVVIFEKNNTGFSLVHPDNGLLGKNKGVLFPVSPHKAIVGMPKRTYGYHISADSELSDLIIRSIVANALMFIYSNSENEYISELRPRTVDESEFQKWTDEMNTWFDNYKKTEGPMLRR